MGHKAPSKVIYHYTNRAGLIGILGTDTIWATDVEFLNDAQELEYARHVLTERLRAKAEDGGERAGVLRGMASLLDPIKSTEEYFVVSAYAACFCEDRDLLSQWRAYGADVGFAIGFYASELQELSCSTMSEGAVSQPASLHKIIYGLPGAQIAIEKYIENMEFIVGGDPDLEPPMQALNRALPILASIKHPAFAQEKEWRSLLVGWRGEDGLQFRASALGAVPYVGLELPAGWLAEVVVGPGSHRDVLLKGVRRLLDKHGWGEVQIRASESPLRR